MEVSFLNRILVDPETDEPLIFDNLSGTLKGPSSNKVYSFIEEVPCIMADDNLMADTEIHSKYGTKFHYVDHYQKDAAIFDYFQEVNNRATGLELRRLQQSIIREITGEMSLILDAGCGGGWVSKVLVPSGKKVISMDVSPGNPVKAIRELKHKNHAGLIADIYNIPLKEKSLDCIIASEVMEHLPDPRTFIIKMLKLLKKNGKLIITTPYNEKIEYYLCVHCNRPTPKNAHLYSFNESNIIQLIPEKGIKWKYDIFMNKYLLKIRADIVLGFLSFSMWRKIDKMFNFLYNYPARLKIVIVKD